MIDTGQEPNDNDNEEEEPFSETVIIQTPELRASLRALTKDMRAALRLKSADEARFLVDTYYMMQRQRIRASHQARACATDQEPAAVLTWLMVQSTVLENFIKSILDQYTKTHPIGPWLRGITGIGPVIAAGLVANIKIEKAPTVGHIWSYAGLNPTVTWGKGESCPWNRSLKTLCWKLGESFVKHQNNDKDMYGRYYLKRRKIEERKNAAGEFADLAAATLAAKNISKKTDAYKWYSGEWTRSKTLNKTLYESLVADKLAELRCDQGYSSAGEEVVQTLAEEYAIAFLKTQPLRPMLPPARIYARSKRWAVKLFLSHMHGEWYRTHYGEEPPLPYPIAFMADMGHSHFIAPPPTSRASEENLDDEASRTTEENRAP